jgi:hypothetical protein
MVEKRTADFVALGASRYGNTSWPVRLFNPIIQADDEHIELMWDTDASGQSVMKYLPKIDHGIVYRKFVLVRDEIRCLADYPSATKWKDVQVHINMGSLGVRKSYPTDEDKVAKLLLNWGLPLPSVESRETTEWFNVLRALPLEEMGMSTNLNPDDVPGGEGQLTYRMHLGEFLKRHPWSEDEPLVADWDYGPDDLAERCRGMVGVAAGVCAQYGGPPARDPYHVDIKLNPLWILGKKPWPRFGAPDGNWYKDTLDEHLKGIRPLWTAVG